MDCEKIKIHKDKVIQHIMEDFIKQELEYNRSTGESKQHNQVLIMPSGGVESRQMAVLNRPLGRGSVAQSNGGEGGGGGTDKVRVLSKTSLRSK